MTQLYWERLVALVSPATSRTLGDVRLEYKHFFSGAAVYANGRIFISLTPVGFGIKLPEQSRIALLKHNGARQLRYFPDGPIKKDYVVLPDSMLKDRRSLRHWIRVSIEYVLTRPRPDSRPRGK
ncbi:MAG: TfoX/Sxy family protein [Candidatus Rokubacteria bacterium]|nr:TfoX/Sxy family protein [Candidatus Rokubacteria bacterium]